MKSNVLSFVLICLVCVLCSCASLAASETRVANIALGKKYSFDQTTQTTAFMPNYQDDANDVIQLTDGKYSNEPEKLFWTQPGTVGWSGMPVVSITIDLEKIEPVSRVVYSTAAGAGGVQFPAAISLFVSDEGQKFHYAGDLILLSAKSGVPDERAYTTHSFVADHLELKGRYIRLIVRASGQFTMCDEIEIGRGPAALLQREHTDVAINAADMAAMEAYTEGMVTDSGVRKRLRRDLKEMQASIASSKLPDSEKRSIQQRLNGLSVRIEELPKVEEKGFRAIFPLNDLHAEILACYAPILRQRRLPPLTVWQNNPWDPLELHEVPERPRSNKPAVRIAMMNNEVRSSAFNITNATDAPANVTLQTDSNSEIDGFMSIFQVEWVDTTSGVVIADPLVPARKTADGFSISVPSGVTRQVWLTFSPQKIAPGQHRTSLKIIADNQNFEVPVWVEIYPQEFPEQPSLSLYMWDYANGGQYGKATDAVLSDMRAHHVDSAWGNDDVVPEVAPAGVDDQGNLVAAPDFTEYDAWVRLWNGRGVRRFFIAFHGSREHFAGKMRGTPAFNRAVSQWAGAWAQHNKDLGLMPGQVAICAVDEPQTAEQGQRIVEWSNAIKAGTPDLLIFSDPVHTVKWDSKGMLEASDILCANLGDFSETLPQSQEIFDAMKGQGKIFEFYSCSGPATLMDPYYYYRLQAWYCWKYGATGSGFWSYFDSGGESAWNPYHINHASFTPVYLDSIGITGGKHWEAAREGVQDYEYLRMLSDALERSEKSSVASEAASEATMLLETLPNEVVPGDYDQAKAYKWDREKDRSVADQARRRILDAMIQLQPR